MYFVLLVACILDQWLNASCDIAQIQKYTFRALQQVVPGPGAICSISALVLLFDPTLSS